MRAYTNRTGSTGFLTQTLTHPYPLEDHRQDSSRANDIPLSAHKTSAAEFETTSPRDRLGQNMFLFAVAALSYAPGLTPPAVSSRVSAVSMKGFDQEVRDVHMPSQPCPRNFEQSPNLCCNSSRHRMRASVRQCPTLSLHHPCPPLRSNLSSSPRTCASSTLRSRRCLPSRPRVRTSTRPSSRTR